MRFASSQRLVSAMAVMAMAALVPATATAQTGGISGTVTSGATPLAGIQVQIYNSAESFVVTATPTSASGAFSVAGLAPGTYYAFAFAGNVSGGYVDTLYPNTGCLGSPSSVGTYCRVNTGSQIVVSSGATTSGIDFDLAVGGTVSGLITAAGVGYAGSVAELHAHFGGSTSRLMNSATTNAGGAYQFGRLPAGNYYVWAGNVTGGAAAGYVPELFDDIPCPKGSGVIQASSPGCSLASATALGVAPGVVSTASMDLSLGGAIAGTVLGSGLPRPGMVVNALRPAVDFGGSTQGLVSSVTGAYLVKGLPAGGHLVSASGAGHFGQSAGSLTSVSAGVISAGPTFDLLPANPYIPYSHYQPASRAVLGGQPTTLSVTALGQTPLSYQWYFGTSGDTSTPIVGATSRDYITPPVVAVANYWVQVSNAFGFTNSQTANVVPAGAGTGAISGTVTSGGQPVRNVVVNLYSNSEQLVGVAPATSASGAYSFAGLAPGTYFAFASVGGVAGNVTGSLAAPPDHPYADVLYPSTCVRWYPQHGDLLPHQHRHANHRRGQCRDVRHRLRPPRGRRDHRNDYGQWLGAGSDGQHLRVPDRRHAGPIAHRGDRARRSAGHAGARPIAGRPIPGHGERRGNDVGSVG